MTEQSQAIRVPRDQAAGIDPSRRQVAPVHVDDPDVEAQCRICYETATCSWCTTTVRITAEERAATYGWYTCGACGQIFQLGKI